MTDARIDQSYAALTTGCAQCSLPARDQLVVTGADRLRFVNGMVTCDTRSLEPGSAVFGFLTSAQGKILADVVISAAADSLRLDLPAGSGETVASHMLRFRVADRVEIEPAPSSDDLVLAGPESEAVLIEVGSQAAAGVERFDERRLGVSAVRLRGTESLISELRRRLEARGVVTAHAEAVAAVRIERGAPWFGIDFGEDHFPQESGLEAQAVSYTKGCYLGQEIVARIHYRGHVNRWVRGLRRDRDPIPVAAALYTGGEEVGRVTSAAHSPSLDGPIALGMVHRKAQGSVALETGEELILADLPFVSG